jgi:secreted trypsin-like serine protease
MLNTILFFERPLIKCIFPECGKLGEEVIPLVVNGQEINYGAWPWQAGLFTLQAGNWTFRCGGSLVSEYVVITGQCYNQVL